MRKEIVALHGEIVTCEAGHEVYRVVVDQLRSHRMFRHTHYRSVHPEVPNPRPDVKIPVRCPCGASLIRSLSLVGMQMHFADGWRPSFGA